MMAYVMMWDDDVALEHVFNYGDVLGMFGTLEEAVAAIHADIDEYSCGNYWVLQIPMGRPIDEAQVVYRYDAWASENEEEEEC